MAVNVGAPEKKTGGWQVVGASVAGTSHLQGNVPCHDSFRYKVLSPETVLVAVSDGAGSAAQPQIGSALAVESAMTTLEKQFSAKLPEHERDWRVLLQDVFHEAKAALERKAAETGIALREYAATLIVLVLTKGWTVSGLIGDCAVVVLTATESLESLCQPQKGEYANTTNFLTQDDALARLDIRVLAESSKSAAVFSDGLLELALNISANAPYSPFFKPLFVFIEHVEQEQEAQNQLATFLNSERVNARTDDDKTLILVHRNYAENPFCKELNSERTQENTNAGDN